MGKLFLTELAAGRDGLGKFTDAFFFGADAASAIGELDGGDEANGKRELARRSPGAIFFVLGFFFITPVARMRNSPRGHD